MSTSIPGKSFGAFQPCSVLKREPVRILDLSVRQQIFSDTLHFTFWLLGLKSFKADFCRIVLLWIVLHCCKNSELN